MNAKKMIIWALSLGVIISASSAYSAENIIKNSSFEEVNEGKVPDWGLRQADGEDNPVKLDNMVAHTGKNSMSISHKNQVYSSMMQNIDVKPKTNYVASVWVKLDNVIVTEKGLGVKLYIGQCQDPWKTVKASPPYRDSCDWTKISLTFNSGEENKIQFIGYLHDASGKVWFDDFELMEVTMEVTETEAK